MSLLLAKVVSILEKYADFSDVFFKKSAAVLPNRSEINKHIIDLEPDKQPLYRPIYSLGPVELETFNTYIEANLANRFIRSFKSLEGALIFFVQKPNESLHLMWITVV